MDRQEMLMDYYRRFRVECNLRMSMIPGVPREMPFYIYEGAHAAVSKEIRDEFDLSSEYESAFDGIFEYFNNSLKETDHFGKSDAATSEALERGEF